MSAAGDEIDPVVGAEVLELQLRNMRAVAKKAEHESDEAKWRAEKARAEAEHMQTIARMQHLQMKALEKQLGLERALDLPALPASKKGQPS